MLRFYLILIVYLLIEIAAFIFIDDFSQLLFLLVISSILFVASIVWGVVCVKSQMFIPVFNNNPKQNNKIALSYDDGPDSVNTVKILEILEKYNAKANFFLIGEKLKKNQEIAKELHNAGHFIGNHSYYHKNTFPVKLRKNIKKEIADTNAEIEKITGKKNMYFRPPFGVINPTISRAISSLNMQVIGWSIRSFDTKNTNKEKILSSIISKIKSGDIILLHDTSKHVLWLTEELLKYFKENNLQTLRIDKLIDNN